MKRDKVEMVRDVLMLCRNPRKVTEILRLANIQFNSFTRIVEPLVEKSFLIQITCPKKEDKRTRYKWMTTAEGKILLGEILEVLSKVGT